MFSPSIFRANDIRGLWKKDFDLQFVKDLSQSLALLIKNKKIKNPKILVGYDARTSSPIIYKTLTKELKNLGINTCGIGLAPSPLCYFLLSHFKFTACIVITASHNPKNFNGFKIVFHKRFKILDSIFELKKLIGKKRKIVSNKKGKSLKISKDEAYIQSLKKEFQLKDLSLIIDTGNGALGPLAKKVFKALGLKVKILFEKPDGSFPNHHPDPTIEENLKDIKKELKTNKYDMGLAFDGDGDRLVLLTKNGRALLGDELAFLLLKTLKKKKNPPLVLADVKCGDWFFKMAKKEGKKVKMIKSGHSLVRSEVEKRNPDLAIEFSGHIFFNDKKGRGFDDPLYAALRLFKFYLSQGKSLEELLPQILSEKTGEIRIPKKRKDALEALEKIKAQLRRKKEKFCLIDGLRLSRNEAWCLFRLSTTQSVLSMRFEAKNKKELKALKEEFEDVVGFTIPLK